MKTVRWTQTIPGEPRSLASVDVDAIVAGKTSEVADDDAERAEAAGIAEIVVGTAAPRASKVARSRREE